MSNVKKLLELYIQKNVIVDIQTYTDCENTITGFINQVSNDLVCILEVDDDGTHDGFIIIKLENIYYIRSDNNLLQTIAALAKEQNETLEIKKLNLTSLLTAINDMKKHYEYTSFFIENINTEECYVGKIISTGELVFLHEFTNLIKGQESQVMLRYKDITRIGYGGKYEENIVKIYINENNGITQG